MAASLRKQLVDRRRVVHDIVYRRDGIQVRSGMQLLNGITSNSNATTDGINAGNISAHNDRCKAV